MEKIHALIDLLFGRWLYSDLLLLPLITSILILVYLISPLKFKFFKNISDSLLKNLKSTVTDRNKEIGVTRERIVSNNEDNEQRGIFLIFLLIVSAIITGYYLIEHFLLNLKLVNNTLDIIDKGISIVVTSIGVIITAIFSYLIYKSTKNGIKIANNILTLERDRRKEEMEKKYSQIEKVPQFVLLQTIDYVIAYLEYMIESDSIEFASRARDNKKELQKVYNLQKYYNNNFFYHSFINRIDTLIDEFYLELSKNVTVREVLDLDDHKTYTTSELQDKMYTYSLKLLVLHEDPNVQEIQKQTAAKHEVLLKEMVGYREDLITKIQSDLNALYSKSLADILMNVLIDHKSAIQFWDTYHKRIDQ